MTSDFAEGPALNNMFALLCQPEIKLMKMARANNTPAGNPMATCFKNFCCFTLFADQ